MKKTILIMLLIGSIAFSLKSQSLQITPFAGYTFADRFTFADGHARIGDGFTYGGILSYDLNRFNSIEFTYSRQNAEASAYSFDYDIDAAGKLTVSYFFIGGNRLFPISDAAVLFSGLNLGMVYMADQEPNLRTSTLFAAGIKGGVKYFLTERIGLRLQANLNFPVTDVGTTFWWDSSGGPSLGVSSNVPILQFGFIGGLVLKL